jgi:putative ABC transport system permease protein
VVSEVKYLGLDKPDDGTVYWPMSDRSLTGYFVVRTQANPAPLGPALQRTARELDPAVSVANIATMEDLVAQSLDRPESLSLLVSAFAFVALALSIVGICGVMAYYVQQHVKEIGIRIALGGTSSDVLRLVLGQGMRVVAVGVVCGLVAAMAGTRLLSTWLFGVGAADARTFVGVSGALLLVAFAACLWPALRAVAIQPAVVLRTE